MKVRDSGMPNEMSWNSFFNIDLILNRLLINSEVEHLAEIGCGYGTFTLSAAKLLSGNLYAFDIDKNMIDHVKKKIMKQQINNIVLSHKDVLTHTTGLSDNSIDYVMLFNILHHESPQDFFDESHRILKPTGKIGIIHWRSDTPTPRGPDLSIRPKPDEIVEWFKKSQFEIVKPPFTIEPYHFGLVVAKRQSLHFS